MVRGSQVSIDNGRAFAIKSYSSTVYGRVRIWQTLPKDRLKVAAKVTLNPHVTAGMSNAEAWKPAL